MEAIPIRPQPTANRRRSEGTRTARLALSTPFGGRHFGLIVHGDSVGAETLRRSLSDWLTDMNLISAGNMAECDGYVGYMKPYATSHEDFDEDTAFQEAVRNAARA